MSAQVGEEEAVSRAAEMIPPRDDDGEGKGEGVETASPSRAPSPPSPAAE